MLIDANLTTIQGAWFAIKKSQPSQKLTQFKCKCLISRNSFSDLLCIFKNEIFDSGILICHAIYLGVFTFWKRGNLNWVASLKGFLSERKQQKWFCQSVSCCENLITLSNVHLIAASKKRLKLRNVQVSEGAALTIQLTIFCLNYL